MPFTLEELLPPDQQLRSVQSHDAVTHAIDLMHRHGYSQLPVVEADMKTSNRQVVTFDGILQRIQSFNTQTDRMQVKDVAKRVRTYAPDADLLTTLDDIEQNNFALIVGESNMLRGIVTTSDTTAFFREYAEDLMQIEGIELRMKEAITALFADNDGGLAAAIAKVTDRAADIRRKLRPAIYGYLEKSGIAVPSSGQDAEALAEAERRLALPSAGKPFDMLTFDEVMRVMLDHPNAPRLGRSNEVSELRILLEKVRDARNKLAHFRGELGSEERRHIKVASEWLEENLPAPSSPPSLESQATVIAAAPSSAEKEEHLDAPHGTYAALSKFLASLAPTTISIRRSFDDIEQILGKELPASAFAYRAWWANDSSRPQSAAWLNEGWRTSLVSMKEQHVTFNRSSERADAYDEFFKKLHERLEQEESLPLRDLDLKGAGWRSLIAFPWKNRGQAACIFATFTRNKQLRVELYLDAGNRVENEERFEELFARRAEFESIIGELLSWEFREGHRACRIAIYTPADIEADFANPELLEWTAQKAILLHKAFAPEFKPN